MIEYNSVVSKGDYTINFHTDNREQYREIEERIRQLIDKSVVEKEEKSHLSKAMSQSADKIKECVREQMNQALEEVSERQDEEIAQKAIELKTGARGLRTILESVITDVMYEIPSRTDVQKVIVNASVVRGEAKPTEVIKEAV